MLGSVPEKGDTMSDLFDLPMSNTTESGHLLAGTTILKSYAVQLATEIMSKIPEGDAEFVQRIKDSQASVSVMDNLVVEMCGDRLVYEPVKSFDEEEIKKLLKSNQSNRSRRKSLQMTQSNYVEMLTSAIAEWVLRKTCGITKGAAGFGTGRAAVTFESLDLEALAQDQDELARIIRNWQSKKSTYKSKHMDQPGWETAEEYVQICAQLDQLRSYRVTANRTLRGVSPKRALQFIFDGVGPTETLSKDDSYALLNACREIAKGNYPQAYLDKVAEENAAKAEAAEMTEGDAEVDVLE